MLVDRVIAQLDAGEYRQAFPTLDPISFDGTGMLFSTNYNEYGSPDRWSVSTGMHSLLAVMFMFNEVQLKTYDYTVDLTKDQRKRLMKAFDRAIKEARAEWKRRKKEAAL